jgi:threonine synthase
VSSRFVCTGCGAEVDEERDLPFRCQASVTGDRVDHVLTRILTRPAESAAPNLAGSAEANPFLCYRELLHSWHFAQARAISDEVYCTRIRRLDDAVRSVDGTGLHVTPAARSAELSDALGFREPGGVFVKNETGNVAGSHKARHLFEVLCYLEMREAAGLGPGRDPSLAIASCGNAALAAAVLACAGRRHLEVFVPAAADPSVLARLRELEAEIVTCPRDSGVSGDPCVRRFREAVSAGALPFTVQGSENGLAIEGGYTLGYELVDQLRSTGEKLDRLFIQVGGGALASACIAGLCEARAAGALEELPRVHAVQTRGCHPLARAHERLAGRIRERLANERGVSFPTEEEAVAQTLREHFPAQIVRDKIRYAATHRDEFMWPWETEPTSIAEGILDDETYDWLGVVHGLLETGGYPVVVDDETIREAAALAATSLSRPASFTGAAGLAGLIELRARGVVGDTETVGVILTGAARAES